jgi:hypothetical protein
MVAAEANGNVKNFFTADSKGNLLVWTGNADKHKAT